MPLKFNPLLKIGLDEVNAPGTGGAGSVSIGSAIGSGTSGSVLFIDASGNLAQDNANLFWDDTNNRLGIGTATPNKTLEVGGDVWVGLSSATNNVITFVRPTGGYNQLHFDNLGGDNHLRNYRQISPYNMELACSSGIDMVIDSNNNETTTTFRVLKDAIATAGTVLFQVQEDGNVGIGTSTPTQGKLNIVGDVGASTPLLTLQSVTPASYGTLMRYYAPFVENWYSGMSVASSAFKIYSDSQPSAFTILTTTGAVGINNTSPAAKLSVISTTEQLRLGYDASKYASFTVDSEGDITINTALGNYIIEGTSTTGPVIDYDVNASTATTWTAFRMGNGTMITTASSGTFTNLTMTPGINTSGTHGYTILNINPQITAEGSGSKYLIKASLTNVDKFTVSSIGTTYVAGNLGIGTTAPDKALEINSASGANLRLTYNDADGSATNYVDFSTSSSGDLTVAPSGSDFNVTGRLTPSLGVVPRVVTTTDDATAVIDVTVTDVYELSAIANATTFSTTGTPIDGQKLIVRFKDDGGSETLTWDAIFVAIGVTLPTATTAGKWTYVGFQYNSAATKFHALAVGTQA